MSELRALECRLFGHRRPSPHGPTVITLPWCDRCHEPLSTAEGT